MRNNCEIPNADSIVFIGISPKSRHFLNYFSIGIKKQIKKKKLRIDLSLWNQNSILSFHSRTILLRCWCISVYKILQNHDSAVELIRARNEANVLRTIRRLIKQFVNSYLKFENYKIKSYNNNKTKPIPKDGR